MNEYTDLRRFDSEVLSGLVMLHAGEMKRLADHLVWLREDMERIETELRRRAEA